MNDLLEMLQSQLGDEVIDQISGQLGAPKQQTGTAVAGALPIILQALNRNAANPGGAQALAKALEKDHDGSLLDNLGGFLGQAGQGPGAGILKHVLGAKRPVVEQALSGSTGMDKQSTGKLLEILAPIVMAQLGKQKRSQGLNADSLMAMLNATAQRQAKTNPQSTSLAHQLLDRDGDGNITEEITQLGMKALGGLFKRKRQ